MRSGRRLHSGLYRSFPLALVGVVTVESIWSNRGLGQLVRSANQFFVSGVRASIVVMVMLSLTVLSIVLFLQRWLLQGGSESDPMSR
jgi:ABC-type nitrate/sulfonate/bicarbonate transport system permease component